MSETFTFDVAYDTTFEQLEELRGKMIAFLQKERRDFLPSFDLAVVGRCRRCSDKAGLSDVVSIDIPDQAKMSLKVDISYKSNWQQTHMRGKVYFLATTTCTLTKVCSTAPEQVGVHAQGAACGRRHLRAGREPDPRQASSARGGTHADRGLGSQR
jgi:hypothetical protein